MNRRLIAALGVAAVALLALASPAMARDRNRDRIPDRWERQHHLSLKVNQARRDQDHDGLRNLAEFRAHLDPRDADTDDDGIGDEQEHAGTVKSFSNGVLTIALADGSTLSGHVTDATEIECDETARASDDGPGSRDDDQGDDRDEPGDDDDQDDDDQAAACGQAALEPGVDVREAELETENGQAVFEKVELKR